MDENKFLQALAGRKITVVKGTPVVGRPKTTILTIELTEK